MKRSLASLAAGVVLPLALFSAPVAATNEGQIEGGDIYRVKNITKNVDFTDPANASSCDVLQYKVRIHNPGPGVLSGVAVKATLPNTTSTSNISTVTVSAINADPASTNDTATVNLASAQSISYVAGSTQLLDANNGLIKTLPDGVTTGGVSIGNVGVSINEKRFVQFQAKVSCPTPVQPIYSCDALGVTQISRTKFSFTAKTTAANGATITNYAFDFGDGTKVNSATNTVTHEYVKEGKYVVTATLSVKVGNQTTTLVGKDCTNGVTVTAEPTTPTTPLPNTGPGAVVGLFAASSIAAGTAHYVYNLRRARFDV